MICIPFSQLSPFEVYTKNFNKDRQYYYTMKGIEKMNTASKNILKKTAGSLFTAGLAVCLGSGLSIIYLECIRLLSDSVLTKNAGKIWSIFAVFSVSIMISALLLCVQNSKALTIKQRLIESLEQNAVDIWLGSNYKNIRKNQDIRRYGKFETKR